MRRVTAITYHADLKEVQGDAALAGLLASTACAPFDRLAWWQGLCEVCGLAPLLAIAREGDAMAALALSRGKWGLEGLANYYSFRWKPLLTPGSESLLKSLAADLARLSPRITLASVPDEDRSAGLLTEAFRCAGWWVDSQPCDTNHILEVRSRSYADYLSGRPGSLRTALKRKAGKVDCVLFSAFDALAWDEYETVYRQSWKPPEGSPAFLRRFAKDEGAAGRLRMGIARAEGRAIAAQMWTVEGGTAWIHKLAHTEDAKALSPGTTLSAALFEQVIDRDRVSLVDFGTGDDGYKRDWMEQVRLRHRLDFFRPARPANWLPIAKAALRRLAPGAKHG